MITAEGCSDCKAAKAILNIVSKKLGIQIQMTTLDLTSEDAIDLAIEYNLLNVPALVIEDCPVDGPRFTEKRLVTVFKMAMKNV